MSNYHNVRNQEAALKDCRDIFRHDELIDILEALHKQRKEGRTVEELLKAIKGAAG